MDVRLNPQPYTARRTSFAPTVQLVIAVIVLFWGGFFTMDYLLSGVYTWPRTSRILALSLAAIILSYEFVYKEKRKTTSGGGHGLRVVFYTCMHPYMLGSLLLLVILSLG